jgi:hypothetical protein
MLESGLKITIIHCIRPKNKTETTLHHLKKELRASMKRSQQEAYSILIS